MKTAIFPCLGLGDGLIALILSNNLASFGHEVDTFHPILDQLQTLFPHLSLKKRPETYDFLDQYDRLIIIYEKLDWMQGLIKVAKEKYPEKTTILNPIATPNCDYPYWEEGCFDGRKPFADNLVAYLKDKIRIENPTKSNGIVFPPHVVLREHRWRVILHPTSSRAGKNWSKEKFINLASRLEKQGFEPVFILTPEEKKQWPEIEAPTFHSLVQIAEFVAQSGYMIGNDSGIGHLASCIGVPTLTICRSKLAADFWRPAWAKGKVIIPPKWIPNLKGMRWRDKKWQKFVPVRRVYKEFLRGVHPLTLR